MHILYWLQDLKVSAQAMVEVPYVYLLAGSGSAVKDQILYVPTRLEDIKELAIPLTMNGIT